MEVARKNTTFTDITGHVTEPVLTNNDGRGDFRCPRRFRVGVGTGLIPCGATIRFSTTTRPFPPQNVPRELDAGITFADTSNGQG